ncbi:hypothetical protein TNCV_2849061 [Trichonephila clavipes]|nr:hypothetical protein TNCV_2849061 [Trichonephila clavipes]
MIAMKFNIVATAVLYTSDFRLPKKKISRDLCPGSGERKNRYAVSNIPHVKHGGGYASQFKKSSCTIMHGQHVLLHSDRYPPQEIQEE